MIIIQGRSCVSAFGVYLQDWVSILHLLIHMYLVDILNGFVTLRAPSKLAQQGNLKLWMCVSCEAVVEPRGNPSFTVASHTFLGQKYFGQHNSYFCYLLVLSATQVVALYFNLESD